MNSGSVLHCNQVTIRVHAIKVAPLRVMVSDINCTKELEGDNDNTIIIVLGFFTCLIDKQPRWKCWHKLHLELLIIIEEKQIRSQEHQFPHTHELSSGTTETCQKATSMFFWIREGRRSHEGRTFHERTAIPDGIHERQNSTILSVGASHFEEKLVVKLSTDKLQVVLVGHVGPNGLVLKPSRGKGHHSSHIITLSLKVGR
mmetsp:Transcript_10696/g.15109  ORF Transcript_10696/g.15109 Transcript_10696/m.15109 type:complete len:201 (+) Transcript_10696:150-752(+)